MFYIDFNGLGTECQFSKIKRFGTLLKAIIFQTPLFSSEMTALTLVIMLQNSGLETFDKVGYDSMGTLISGILHMSNAVHST